MKTQPRIYAQAARKLKAMGHPARLKLLAALDGTEHCVGRLQSCLRLSQPHVSQSLRVLKTAGLVRGRREGNMVRYRVVDPSVKRILAWLKVKEFSS
jgi:ArsR family transcriptional regulator